MSGSSEAAGDSDIFQKLDSYDWENDKQFQGGLTAILGPNPAPSQVQDLTIRAQCFYLARKEKTTIDFDSYKTYLTNKYPERFSQASLPTSLSTSNMSIPARNSSASASQNDTSSSSTHAVNSPETPQTEETTTSHSTHPVELPPALEQSAPYPPTFAEIVELISSGTPIPGIRDIPCVPAPHLASKSSLPRRRKPWETDIPEEVILNGPGEGMFGDHRDNYIVQEYPEEETPSAATT
ncbi:hypothetical protein HYALB_00007496 [Hymenoscyphus albidus]|uniref:Uncharacterized protein n=1 Tax=Hymenoscyphus albidus TaxID=595503 RepID=A0A9N9M1I3_9HELO|nr:hypothetical protein HYALB_00007496 [Hymenoscyphus albidus]